MTISEIEQLQKYDCVLIRKHFAKTWRKAVVLDTPTWHSEYLLFGFGYCVGGDFNVIGRLYHAAQVAGKYPDEVRFVRHAER